MIAALVWKEYREHRNVWVALAGLAVLVIGGLFFLLDPPGVASTVGGKNTLLLLAGFVVAGTYGVVCGAMMLADERDSGTLPFLDALTARRTPIWRTKLLLGLVFTLLHALFIATLVVPFLPRHAEQPHETQVTIVFVVTIAVALEAFVWGFFLSGFFKHALTAAGTAAVVVVVLYSLSLGMIELEAMVAAFAVRSFLVIAALWASWRMFCREDAERTTDVGKAVSLVRAIWAGFIGEHVIWGRMILLIVIAVGLVMFVPDPTGVLAPMLLLFAAGVAGGGSGAMALGGKPPAALAGLRGNVLRASALWLASVCVGLFVASLLVLLPLANQGPVNPWALRIDFRAPLVWTCLESFAGGLLLSTLLGNRRSAFRAALVFAALLAVLQVFGPVSLRQIQDFHGYGLVVAIVAILGSAIFFLVRHVRFGAPPLTWELQEDAPPAPARVHKQLHAVHATRLWPIVWLTLRQARVLAMVLAVAALGVGLAVRWYGVVVWPVFTLLVGILCGIGVYGEQSSGAHRFLGDQRLPPGQLWLVKTGVWLALAVLICVLAFLPAALIAEWQQLDRRSPDSNAGLEQYLGDSALVAVSTPKLFLTLWLAYGFAVGQFFGLSCTKPPVAVVLSLLVAPVLSALWIPSLVGGGLHLWQVFLPPLVLLLATRLGFWTWTAGGLHRPRPILFQAGLGLVSVAGLAGGLWYRVLEVPDLGEPFDVAAFEAGFPTPEQNRAGMLIRSATRELEELRQAGEFNPVKPRVLFWDESVNELSTAGLVLLEFGSVVTHSGFPPLPWTAFDLSAADVIAAEHWLPTLHPVHALFQVVWEGWPSHPSTDLVRTLDFLFAGRAWHVKLRELRDLPLGMVRDPRLVHLSKTLGHEIDTGHACLLLNVRALQIQAQGDHARALEMLVTALALARHNQSFATRSHYDSGRAGGSTVNALDQWLNHVGPQPQLIRQALHELNRHTAQTPPESQSVKVEWLVQSNRLAIPPEWLGASGRADSRSARSSPELDRMLIPLSWNAPWERRRQRRILNALGVSWLKELQRDYREEVRQKGAATRHSSMAYSLGLESLLEEGSRLSADRWGELLLQSGAWQTYGYDSPRYANDGMMEARIRVVQIKLAICLYKLERKERPRDLSQLVPAYLPVLPTNPFRSTEPYSLDPSGRQLIEHGPGPEMGPLPTWLMGR